MLLSLSPLLWFVPFMLLSFSEWLPFIGKFRPFLLGEPFVIDFVADVEPFGADCEELETAFELLKADDKLPGTADLPRITFEEFVEADELLGTDFCML